MFLKNGKQQFCNKNPPFSSSAGGGRPVPERAVPLRKSHPTSIRRAAGKKSFPAAGPRLSKKSKNFSDSLKECRYFPAAQRRKSPRCARRTPCPASRSGHSISLETGCRPLELPRHNSGGFLLTEVFHKPKPASPDGEAGFSAMPDTAGPCDQWCSRCCTPRPKSAGRWAQRYTPPGSASPE